MISSFRKIGLLIFLGSICLPLTLSAEMIETEYEGTLVSKPRGKEPQTVKQFMLYSVRDSEAGERADSFFWLIDDGGTGWHWPEAFGWQEDADKATPIARESSLLHTHDNSPAMIALPPVIIPDGEKLKTGTRWNRGRQAFEVLEQETVAGKPVAKISISTNFGRAGTMRVNAVSGELISSQQKLFLGRGDEFELNLTQKRSEELSADRAEKVLAALEKLKALQAGLNRKADSIRPQLSAEQLKLVSAEIEELESLAENTPLQALSVEIHRDLKVQTQRTSDVASIADRFLGKKLTELSFTTLNGKPLEQDAVAGKILVLHFWKYHSDPLQEPYGQVGYIDFLHNKRSKLGVTVLGVAVDEKFGATESGKAIERAVKKLVSFMNLGYEVLRDDGSLISKFGDPRKAGAELPLTVVLSPEGEIVHYKAGLYEVNPREGLQELDAVVVEQIKKQREEKKE